MRGFRYPWRAAVKATGLRITPHDLRRSGVRNLVQAGVDRDVARTITARSRCSLATISCLSRLPTRSRRSPPTPPSSGRRQRISRRLDEGDARQPAEHRSSDAEVPPVPAAQGPVPVEQQPRGSRGRQRHMLDVYDEAAARTNGGQASRHRARNYPARAAWPRAPKTPQSRLCLAAWRYLVRGRHPGREDAARIVGVSGPGGGGSPPRPPTGRTESGQKIVRSAQNLPTRATVLSSRPPGWRVPGRRSRPALDAAPNDLADVERKREEWRKRDGIEPSSTC